MTPAPLVDALIHYPIKGAAGVRVSQATLTPMGLPHDRTYMLVDDEGRFLSQRTTPMLAVLRPTVLDGRLVLDAPGLDQAEVEIREDGPRLDVNLFDRWYGPGVDQGDAAAKWCSALLEQHCRLVRVPPDHDRPGDGETSSPVGFSDSTALTVTSLSSLDQLNARIEANGGQPVPMNRFRPNIVVSGWPEPHTEDRVRRMTIGQAEITYAKRCIRCAVPLVDQATGRRSGPEPVRTLARYRREPQGVAFAMKAAVHTPAPIHEGDPITVTTWGPAFPD